MSTYTSEPGTRLAGRYRLVDQVAAGGGWTMWKAMDETLARPVSVLTFAPGFPRIGQVVTAARAASRLTDSRLAQVFDVEDGGEQAYVVLEWVGGETLADLVGDGPLDQARACALVAEAARALAGAHAAGQAHLRLTPESVRWTHSSGVKITGLGIDAALAGASLTGSAASDPAITDTRDLAALLYAALTGYWPGESQTGLPQAPVSDGVACTPRQVTADVSPAVDGVVSRALLQRTGRHGPPIESPAEFADALASVAPPVPLPDPAPAMPSGTLEQRYDRTRDDGYGGYPPNPNDPGTWALPDRGRGGGGSYQRGYQTQERSAASRAVISVVIVLVLAAVAATAWVISTSLHKSTSSNGNQATKTPRTSASSPAAAGSTVLKPVGDSTFNILGSPPGNTEDPESAGLAIDNSLSTAWATSYYFQANFGGLKSGTGLLIDMGREVRLNQVTVLFGSQCCTTAQIYLGNSNAMTRTALSNFTKVAPAATSTGQHVYTINSSAPGRYVLIWLTGNLPPMQGQSGKYQALIYNVVIRGNAVSGAA
ncbi:MAG TPA: protein kinase family protein [Trebonia sp.]|nr:protein kinase family protein [Trebonia sp.]